MTATLMYLTYSDLTILYAALRARQNRLSHLIDWYEQRGMDKRGEDAYAKWAEADRLARRVQSAMLKSQAKEKQ